MPGRATLSRHEDMTRVAAEVAPIPRDDDGEPVFREPWEAQAFAMTLALHERGLFTLDGVGRSTVGGDQAGSGLW